MMIILSLLVIMGPAGLVAAPQPAAAGNVALLDPNICDFPDASLADYSDLLSPPAGNHGRLFVGTDGHFYFEDGRRARFWGINIAKGSVFQPRPIIDTAVESIARAGFNIVRLHHIDGKNGLLPPSRADKDNRLAEQKLKAIDYWISELGRRGIYVYLDLLDFRTFYDEEGVVKGEALDRAAKPCAVFDEQLISLQKQYAKQLLTGHRNRYTGLTYAEDPTVCLVELCDENGLFAAENELADLPAQYRKKLQKLWQQWLASEATAIGEWGPQGDIKTGDLPSDTIIPALNPSQEVSTRLAMLQDIFFATVHRDYFTEMIDYLHSAGVKCPITAVTSPKTAADLWACAKELDFISANYYYNHPYFRPGSKWQLPAYISSLSPLRAPDEKAFAPSIARKNVANKPLVIREWNVCWPTRNRPAGMVQAAAYASLQNIDGLILFTLRTEPGMRKVGYFDVGHDPTRWGLAPLCARMFLKSRLKAAKTTVKIGLSADKVFGKQSAHEDDMYGAARISRLQSAFDGGTGTETPPAVPDDARQVSDTDQIFLNRQKGLLRVKSRWIYAIAGNFGEYQQLSCGPLQLKTDTESGACIIQSLGNEPLSKSKRWVLKFATTARNTGQKIAVHQQKTRGKILALRQAGHGPVQTNGKPSSSSSRPTELSLHGRKLVTVYMKGGTFELCKTAENLRFYCDTPKVKVELHRPHRAVGRFRDIRANIIKTVDAGEAIVWPENAAVLELQK